MIGSVAVFLAVAAIVYTWLHREFSQWTEWYLRLAVSVVAALLIALVAYGVLS